jgi:glycosyltransferase involved in cell wall biosynthesis
MDAAYSSPVDRISVVLCTHNGSRFIAEQLESILHQTRSAFELIIQDDNSDDGTVEILKSYAQRYPFIQLYPNKIAKGINENHLSAMAKTKGEYIAVSYQNDIWDRKKLEEQMLCIRGASLSFHPVIPLLKKMPSEIDIDRREPNFGLERLAFSNMISGNTLLIRRDLMEKVLNMPKSILETILQQMNFDVVMAIIAAAYGQIKYCPKVHVFQRVNAQQMSDYQTMPFKDDISIIGYVMNAIGERKNFEKKKPCIIKRLNVVRSILYQFPDAPYSAEAISFIDCYLEGKYMKTAGMCIKLRDRLLKYPDSKKLASIVRAALFPMTCFEYNIPDIKQ